MRTIPFDKILLLAAVAAGICVFTDSGYREAVHYNFSLPDIDVSETRTEMSRSDSEPRDERELSLPRGKNAIHKTENAAGAIVLCYHSFLGHHAYATDFTLDQLKKQLDFLERNGFRFVSVNDITNNRLSGNRNICVTIDDGNISAFTAYKAVFKKRKIKPLFAIYPGVIGKTGYAMKWANVRELSSDGCEIAAHGYSHQRLDDILLSTNPSLYATETEQSKKVLEEQLHRAVTVFVYPYGVHSPAVEKKLKEAGYLYSFTIDSGFLNTPVSPDRAFALPRYMLTVTNWKQLFEKFTHPEKL